jgi:putative PIN family toxin of toxin-antitoxin system
VRLVLDTNIWLDWLVFDNAAIQPLKTASGAGELQIALNPACLGELRRVLAYPAFEIAESRQDALVRQVLSASIAIEYALPAPLPLCADPDDQKFLELARDAQARWLISRDKALLRLGKKTLLAAGFRIGTPQQWVTSRTSPDDYGDYSMNVTASARPDRPVR